MCDDGFLCDVWINCNLVLGVQQIYRVDNCIAISLLCKFDNAPYGLSIRDILYTYGRHRDSRKILLLKEELLREEVEVQNPGAIGTSSGVVSEHPLRTLIFQFGGILVLAAVGSKL
jgi:hypothetical protein